MTTLPLFEAEHTAITEARESEYVPTPAWVVRALVEGLQSAGHPPLPAGLTVEPCAGGGAIVDALEALTGPRRWILCELRQDAFHALVARYRRATVWRGDYLTMGAPVRGADLWITNPPYSIAAEIFAKMRADALSLGTVALHVPWAFAATDALDGVEADLYPIEGRPYGFVRETCWIVTGPGRGGRRLRLRRPS